MWPWLKTIAIRLSIDYSRQRRPEPCEDPCEGRSTTDDTRWLEEGPILEAALAGLPARQRVALKLRYLDDWSPSEAAQALGLTRPAFDQLLFRARGKLRNEYRRVCGDQPTPVHVLVWPLLAVLSRIRHLGWRAKVAAQTASLPAQASAEAMTGLMVAAAVGAAALGVSLGMAEQPRRIGVADTTIQDFGDLTAQSGFAALLPGHGSAGTAPASSTASAAAAHDSWSLTPSPAPVAVPDYPDLAQRLAALKAADADGASAADAPAVPSADAPADPAADLSPGAGKSAALPSADAAVPPAPTAPAPVAPKLPPLDFHEHLGL